MIKGQTPSLRCGHASAFVANNPAVRKGEPKEPAHELVMIGGGGASAGAGVRVLSDINILDTHQLQWSQPVGNGTAPEALVFHGMSFYI
jgi:hypothetical protein